MRRFALLALLMLSACAPSTAPAGTATAQTQSANRIPTFSLAALTTPTGTAILFSGLDLASVLVWPGDLPAGYAASKAGTDRSDLTKDAPTPDYFISQLLSYKGQPGGSVDVLVYEDPAKLASAYDSALGNMSGDLVDMQVGEQAKAAVIIDPTQSVSLSFTRCHAVAVIQLLKTVKADAVLSYAKRLDYRLSPLVCR